MIGKKRGQFWFHNTKTLLRFPRASAFGRNGVGYRLEGITILPVSWARRSAQTLRTLSQEVLGPNP